MSKKATAFKYTNQLQYESSPYLLQHAHNPVNWYPWRNDVLKQAEEENKPLIISIGYAACHWCHVMEHESFEDEEVARLMNDHFICIKVDREERPDIDRIYLDAVQLLSGRGGWPLNVIALPDGRPVYGGTYFPKDQWFSLLNQIISFIRKNHDDAEQQAAVITEAVNNHEKMTSQQPQSKTDIDNLHEIYHNWSNSLDFDNGGMKGAPKFPLPAGTNYLLQYAHISGNDQALDFVNTTLEKMAYGGIYDQIGGGFARYSTDAHWKIPHFEKMLYDNAQLVSLYSNAYRKSGRKLYRMVAESSLDFIMREMTSDEGYFFSSIDADSEGEEGKFYVWTYDEIEKLTGRYFGKIKSLYSISKEGNWEDGKNIPYRSRESVADERSINEASKLLFDERSKRIKPAIDDKMITSWNSLMINGLVDAYRVFGNDEYRKLAVRCMNFILEVMRDPDFRLSRIFKKGIKSVNGFLDDYAFTIEALINMYQAFFDEKHLIHAKAITEYVLSHFYDSHSGFFFYTSDLDPALIARKMEVSDNVIPSSNSMMAKNLYILGTYFSASHYISMAERMVNNVRNQMLTGGPYYAIWDMVLAYMVYRPVEIAIVGSNCIAFRKEFDRHYIPLALLSGTETEGVLPLLKDKYIQGHTNIYVCRDKTCKLPVTSVEEAMHQMYQVI